MKGIPTEHPLASTYWRKTFAPPASMDPDRDGCGLLWCSPVAPNDGASACHLTELVNERVLAHGYEPAISLTTISGRALACIVSLAYDREIPGEDEKVMTCYKDLLTTLSECGYYSYRMAVASPLIGDNPAYLNLLQGIKNTVDPQGVLAPGRYLQDTRIREKRPLTLAH